MRLGMFVIGACLVIFSMPLIVNSGELSDKLIDLEKLNMQAVSVAADLAIKQMEIQAASVELASALRAGIWDKASQIEVCWENPNNDNTGLRNSVRQAVTNTWERESAIRFIGWGKCTTTSKGIRIRINDEGPHCKRLGSNLNGLPDGMVLNFTFNNWSSMCKYQADSCVRSIAIHEFGHALSFAHEQNRPDAPEECKKERQGTTGDFQITMYDPNSIMNYCNPIWNNNGQLSQLDIQAVREVYGSPAP